MAPKKRGKGCREAKDELDLLVEHINDPKAKPRRDGEEEEAAEKRGREGRIMRFVKDPDFAQFCMAVILAIILFSLPPLVGGQLPPNKIDTKHCSHHGFPNGSVSGGDNECICHSGYYGLDCNMRFCPFGPSWLSFPVQNQQRYRPDSECSDVGVCDSTTGTCACPQEYEGRACERLRCPTSSSAGAGHKVGTNMLPPCSGHGRCRSMAYIASHFDGYGLVKPPVTYTNWEADSYQGCICDPGYEGYDCSFRSCPKGPDPSDSNIGSVSYTRYTLNCQASSGYFTLMVMGQRTSPIPYDADAKLVENVLKGINNVKDVVVTIPVVSSIAQVCNSADVQTSIIEIMDLVGPRPPMMVSTKTAASRAFPNGGNVLALSGSTAVLNMMSNYILACPPCASCEGTIIIKYGDDYTEPLNVMETGIKTKIQSEIKTLENFYKTAWSNIAITVIGDDDTICGGAAQEIIISITSDYGNLPSLELLQSVTSSGNALTVSLSDSNGIGAVYECSRQGLCDRKTGTCQCVQGFSDGQLTYKVSSGDGVGGAGSRGDCGHISIAASHTANIISSCNPGGDHLCNNNGYCKDSTASCSCYDNFYGITCSLQYCPTGPAWIDEAESAIYAHAEVECSNMGICDRGTGQCKCNRGYTGAACDVKDCVRDDLYGEPCSGHGWCLNMKHWAEIAGFEYGSIGFKPAPKTSWDADSWYECLCSANTPAGFLGHTGYPTIGPKAMISGFLSESPNLPGYRGHTCAYRNCPVGDTTTSRNNLGGEIEIQRIHCPLEQWQYFHIKFKGQLTDKIYGHYNLSMIKTTIEELSTVGNISVNFINVHGTEHLGGACNSSSMDASAGFLVHFEHDYGDLPMMEPDVSTVVVSEYQKGTRLSLECGGSDMGVCDRVTGKCTCYHDYGSSNGSVYSAGARGDCSYKSLFEWDVHGILNPHHPL